MIVCRSSGGKLRFRRAAALGGALLLAVNLAAVAAENAPASNAGDNAASDRGAAGNEQAQAPIVLTPLDADATAKSDGIIPPLSPSGTTAVETSPLAVPEIDSAGPLNAANGGFAPTLWAGAPYGLAVGLIGAFPDNTPSPALRRLMRRLLLTDAATPVREGAESPSLLATRLVHLSAMGDREGAADLMQLVSTRNREESVARTDVTEKLIAGDGPGACTLIRDEVKRFSSPFWQRAMIYCQAAAHDADGARVGLALLAEQGSSEATGNFTALIEALLAGKPAKLVSLPQLSPLTWVLVRATKTPLPADAVRHAGPAVLAAVAADESVANDTRLLAAEQAVACGVLAPETLSDLYRRQEFAPQDLADPVARAENLGGARGRALLHRAALDAPTPGAHGKALNMAFARAREEGLYGVAVALDLAMARDVPPDGTFIWFAGEAGRALLFAGFPQQARAWFDLLDQASDDVKSRAAADGFLPLLRLGGAAADVTWDRTRLLAWRQTIAKKPLADGRTRLLYALLEALGDPVEPALWQDVLETAREQQPPSPGVSLRTVMARAAASGQIGLAASAVVAGLGGSGFESDDPAFLMEAIAALHRVGLVAEARALAVEIAIAHGL